MLVLRLEARNILSPTLGHQGGADARYPDTLGLGGEVMGADLGGNDATRGKGVEVMGTGDGAGLGGDAETLGTGTQGDRDVEVANVVSESGGVDWNNNSRLGGGSAKKHPVDPRSSKGVAAYLHKEPLCQISEDWLLLSPRR